MHMRTHAQCQVPVGFLILQATPGSCCHQQGTQGWLCIPGLETGLGTVEGWIWHSWAPEWVISLSQGAGCQGRLGALARAVDACFRAHGGAPPGPHWGCIAPRVFYSNQGCSIAKPPLPPQTATSQPREPALLKSSWRDRALPSTKTSCRAALGRGSKLSW